MLLYSWNVAGWSTTYEIICQHYGSFSNYFDKHGRPSVICLQETKIPQESLGTIGNATRVGACPDGYTSYWAPNRQKAGAGKSGFNGVATFVRNDQPVVGATNSPLNTNIDVEGRCLLVDFGSFVVFNVYAPHVGKPEDVHRKMEFLDSLRRAMDSCREAGQHVILMGDMNITYRHHDSKAINRWLKLDTAGRVLDGPWTVDVPEYIQLALVPIRHLVENKLASLSDFTNRGEVHHFPFEPRSVQWLRRLLPTDTLRRDTATVEDPVEKEMSSLAVEKEMSSLAVEKEMSSLAVEKEMSSLAVEKESPASSSNLVVHDPVEKESPASSSPSSKRFVYRDVFAALFPLEKERFTCWNQTKNMRYKNIGSRIDYTIVDEELWELVDKNPEPLFGGPGISGALAACTLHGQWKPAPMVGPLAGLGLSLQRDNMKLNDCQFLPPSTGIVYTPPSYSDHVAVSLKFARHPRELSPSAPKRSWPIKLTRECQPWTQYNLVTSFFKLKEPKRRKTDGR